MTQKINKISDSYLTLNQVRTLIKSISNARDKFMLRLLYETGCSLNELVTIKAKDIQGKIVKIIDNDTKQLRFSHISSKLAKDLKLYIKGNNFAKESFVIRTRQSPNISERRVRQLIQYYSKLHLKITINPQKFRYFHIAHAYTNGILLESISKQVGITTYRIFQILSELKITTTNNYNPFLKKI
jgi:integrase